MSLSIIDALRDDHLLKPFITDNGRDSLRSYHKWMHLLRAVYGLHIGPKASNTIVQTTKRQPALLPKNGFKKALFITGRRSGKSKLASALSVYEACLAGNESKLTGGETGVVALISISKNQASVLRNYIGEILTAPLLANEVSGETKDGYRFKNSVEIKILAGDYKTVRGYSILAAVLDELAFYGISDEGKVKSAEELVRALEPAMLTTGGRMVGITSPWSRKGYCYKTYKNHFGNDASKTLVVNCPSRVLNPTLDQATIDERLAEDPCAGRAEYYGEFREDIESFINRDVVEALVKKGRTSLLPRAGVTYYAFADHSGGRSDDATIAVGHREGRTVVIDLVKRYKAPHDPYTVVADMAKQIKPYGITRVVSDRYAAEWCRRAWRAHNIKQVNSDLNRSAIYLEFLPRLGSGEVELPDMEVLVDQLSSLIRKTRSGGRDIVDHAPGANHDDVANSVAGVCTIASKGRVNLGAMRGDSSASAGRPKRTLESLMTE